MNTLFGDHFNIILSFLTESSLYSLKRTAKCFNHIGAFTKREIKLDAIAKNHTEIFKYFFRSKDFTAKDLIVAVENKNLSILTLIHSDNCYQLPKYCRERYGCCYLTTKAAQNDDLEMLTYLIKLGCSYDKHAMIQAIRNNSILMVNYLSKFIFDQEMYKHAVQMNNFEILEKLIETEKICTKTVSYHIIGTESCKCGNLSFFKFALNHYHDNVNKIITTNKKFLSYATKSNNVEMLQYVISHYEEYIDYEDIVVTALCSDSFNILEWLIENDLCVIRQNLVLHRIIYRLYDLQTSINWLKDHGYIFSEEEIVLLRGKDIII